MTDSIASIGLRPPSRARLTAFTGLAGPILFLGTWLVLGLVTPGYSFSEGHGSDLARGSLGWVMTLNFALTGVLLVAFAGGLALECRLRAAAPLFAITGLGFLASAIFPADGGGAMVTTKGTIHNAAFPIIFLSISFGSILAARALRSRLPRHLAYSVANSVACIILAVAFMLVGSDPGDPLYTVGGYLQFALVVLALGWPAVTAIRLMPLPEPMR